MTKKIIFFLAILLAGIFKVNALEPTIEYQQNIYSNRVTEGKTYSGQLGFIILNGKIVYCLEPLKIIGKNYEQNDESLNQFSKEDLKYFEQVAEAASFYVQEHKNVNYYMAAQELIWNRILGGDKVYWTTENNGGGDRIDITIYMSELEQSIKTKFPTANFNTNKIEGNFYDVITLEDINGTLNDYELINNSKNEVWKDYNHLYVRILSSELSTIKLVKKSTNPNQTKGYTSSDSQLIADLEYQDNHELEFQVKANNPFNSRIGVNFLDKEKKLPVNGEIQFRIFHKDNQTYIGTLFETFNGNFISNFSLEEGTYQLQVLNVPKNYVIGEMLDFTISEEEMHNQDFANYYAVNYYLEQAIGNIIIETTGNDSKMYQYQLIAKENIFNQFQNIIYKKGEVINEFELKSDENISLENLPLGDYIIKNVVTSKQYDVSLDYVDPFTKSIITYVEIENNIIEEKPSLPEDKDSDIPKDENTNIPEQVEKEEKINSDIEKNQAELPNTSNYRKKYYNILLFAGLIGIIGLLLPNNEKNM